MPPKRQPRPRLRRGNVERTSPERDASDQPTTEGEPAAAASDNVNAQTEQPSSAVNPRGESRNIVEDKPHTQADPLGSSQDAQDASEASPSQPEVTDSSKPPRVQRLATLDNPEGGPLPRIPGTRPAGLRFKPKAVQRRTKEEREAAERAEAERQQARLSGASVPGVVERGGFSSRGRGRGNDRLGVVGASGHLGGGTHDEGSQAKRGRGRGRLGGGGGGGRGSSGDPRGGRGGAMTTDSGLARGSAQDSTTRRKKDPAVKTETYKDGNVVMGNTTSKRKVKKEPGVSYGIESSESETSGKRSRKINIEEIDLISSNEDADDEGLDGKGKERAKTPKPRNPRPVRFQRDEHVERTVGVNTEPTTLTSAELRRRAKLKKDAQESMFFDSKEGSLAPSPKPKSRGKTKDVEFIKNERKWQGVYQDDDVGEGLTRVKKEPQDDDLMALDEEPCDPAAQLAGAFSSTNVQGAERELEDTEIPDAPDLPSAGDAEHRSSSQTLQGDARPPSPQAQLQPERLRRKNRPRKPVLQTDEDHDEWARYDDDGLWMRSILSTAGGTIKSDSSTKALDDDGDIDMGSLSIGASERADEIYLFQFPPALPMLTDARIKKEEESTAIPPPVQAPPPTAIPTPGNPSKKPPAKPKSKDPPKDPDPPAHPPPPPQPQTYTPISPPLPPGHMGTLRLHRSNRVTANWGTLEFEIGRSSERQMGQEIVACGWSKTVVKKEAFEGVDGTRIKGEDAEWGTKVEGRGDWREEIQCGEKVWSLGNVHGGWVGVPDLSGMFGV